MARSKKHILYALVPLVLLLALVPLPKAALAADLPQSGFTLTGGPFIFDGTAKTPGVTPPAGYDLRENTHYEVTYSNNINAGTDTAIITITGLDNSAGDGNDYSNSRPVVLYFTIAKANLQLVGLSITKEYDTTTGVIAGPKTTITPTYDDHALAAAANVTLDFSGVTFANADLHVDQGLVGYDSVSLLTGGVNIIFSNQLSPSNSIGTIEKCTPIISVTQATLPSTAATGYTLGDVTRTFTAVDALGNAIGGNFTWDASNAAAARVGDTPAYTFTPTDQTHYNVAMGNAAIQLASVPPPVFPPVISYLVTGPGIYNGAGSITYSISGYYTNFNGVSLNNTMLTMNTNYGVTRNGDLTTITLYENILRAQNNGTYTLNFHLDGVVVSASLMINNTIPPSVPDPPKTGDNPLHWGFVFLFVAAALLATCHQIQKRAKQK